MVFTGLSLKRTGMKSDAAFGKINIVQDALVSHPTLRDQTEHAPGGRDRGRILEKHRYSGVDSHVSPAELGYACSP